MNAPSKDIWEIAQEITALKNDAAQAARANDHRRVSRPRLRWSWRVGHPGIYLCGHLQCSSGESRASLDGSGAQPCGGSVVLVGPERPDIEPAE